MVSRSEIRGLQSEIEHARKHRASDPPAPDTADGPADPSSPAAAPPELPAEVKQAVQGIEDLLGQVDADIVRHPRLAVLAALAAGIVIGSLISR